MTRYIEVQDCEHCPRREYSFGLAGDFISCKEEGHTIQPSDTKNRDFPKWCPLKSRADIFTE